MDLYCSYCRKKTTAVKGSERVKPLPKRGEGAYIGSGICSVCSRGQSQRLGKGFIGTDYFKNLLNDFLVSGPGSNIEKHLPFQKNESWNSVPQKASFCGPGTHLDERLKNYDPQTGKYDGVITPPITELDRACLDHDIAYRHKDVPRRNVADKILAEKAEKYAKKKSTTKFNRLMADGVRKIMEYKVAHQI